MPYSTIPIINTGKIQLDIDLICQFLTNSYWGKGRTREQIVTSIDNMMCFGMYLEGKQIGFTRVLTDKVVCAYLIDVFIIESQRDKGYSKLLQAIFDDVDLAAVDKWFLGTRDAHGLYRRFGFIDAQESGSRVNERFYNAIMIKKLQKILKIL